MPRIECYCNVAMDEKGLTQGLSSLLPPDAAEEISLARWFEIDLHRPHDLNK